MKTTLLTFALLLSSAPAFAASWELDPAHTTVGFSVKHMVVTNVHGQFKSYTGSIVWDDKDITKSTLSVSIDAKSIDTNNAKRDEHLRSPDFFDVAKFASLTFKSTKVEKAKDGKLRVTGNLSIHGATKPVVLTVDGPSAPLKGPWGGTLVSTFHATATINRKDFGLVWNKALEAGGMLVGDEVTIDLEGELNKKGDDRG